MTPAPAADRPALRDGIPADPGRPLRLVAVHAHPDDETLATGVALAHHAAAGDVVDVITCTLGEEGEVIPAELAHLEGSEELGPYRAAEVARATNVLGVRHGWLGGDRPRWRDSGMAGSPAARHPRAFAAADVDEAGALLADRLADLRPDVVLTYDPRGGYGHPDHVQTHRVTLAALRRLAGGAPEGVPPRLYVALTPRSWAREDRAWLAAHVPASARGPVDGGVVVPAPDDPFAVSVVDDRLVTHAVVDATAARVRTAALREHRTQVSVHDGWYALSNDVAARLPVREGYARWEVAPR